MRPVLLFGFAVIFGLWLVSAYELVQRVAEAERQATTITARFTEGEELLFTVRAQVLLSSVYVRDAALDTRPDAASFYREQLQDDARRRRAGARAVSAGRGFRHRARALDAAAGRAPGLSGPACPRC